jgi:hypothetical protein
MNDGVATVTAVQGWFPKRLEEAEDRNQIVAEIQIHLFAYGLAGAISMR